MKTNLKEAIRWLVMENDVKVLQVLQLEFIPEGACGQGKYEEKWINVPAVFHHKSIEALVGGKGATRTIRYIIQSKRTKKFWNRTSKRWTCNIAYAGLYEEKAFALRGIKVRPLNQYPSESPWVIPVQIEIKEL
ncbi:MAG: hypothetical protein ACYSYU_11385 [Planctomycetota bacterium]|jgi:hypothetical protein